MINLKVNDINVSVPNKTTILQACETIGVDIPRFCFHERLLVAGNCRMCLVEIEKSPKPVPSCTIQVMEGMSVYTKTPLVKKAQEAVLEFLLANHPLDCPICDQGGECDLQDQSLNFGSDSSRFYFNKRGVEDKNMGPIIKTVMTRCIHCTRCVRFATEVAGIDSLGVTGRGKKVEIGTYVSKLVKTELSGNIIDLCPVGALTSKIYAFKARPWELKSTNSIDILDGLGSNIVINQKGNEVIRILPRLNEDLNEEWITDKARYSFDGLKNQRIANPLLKINNKFIEIKWETAFEKIKEVLYLEMDKSILNTKISFILGQLTDLNTGLFLQKFKDICKSKVSLSIDKQVSQNYFSKTEVLNFRSSNINKSIEKSDLLILVNTDLKSELPLLGVKIRNHILNSGCCVGVIGDNPGLNFPCVHLGSDVKSFIKLIEGNDTFLSAFINSKTPLILVGENNLSNNINSVHSILKNVNKNTRLNVINSQIAYSGLLELGINYSTKAYKGILFNIGSYISYPKSVQFKIYVGSNGSDILSGYDLILPSLQYLEKSSSYMNFNGIIQKSNKVSTNMVNARSESDIFKYLFLFLESGDKELFFSGFGDFSFYDWFLLNNKTLNLKSLNLNSGLAYKFKSGKTLFSVDDYYLNNIISKSSRVMRECSLSNSKINNF